MVVDGGALERGDDGRVGEGCNRKLRFLEEKELVLVVGVLGFVDEDSGWW